MTINNKLENVLIAPHLKVIISDNSHITGCNKKNGPPSRSIYSLLNHFTTFFYNFDNHSVLPPYTKKLSLDYFYQKFQNCLGKQSKKVSYFGQGVHFFVTPCRYLFSNDKSRKKQMNLFRTWLQLRKWESSRDTNFWRAH